MRQNVPALFHGRGIVFLPGIEMTLLCTSQMSFGVGFLLPRSIRGEIWVRQSVARNPARRISNPEPLLSAVVAHLLGSLGDLVGSSLMARAIASLQLLLCCSPAEHRPSGLLKSRPIADRGHALSQLHRLVHTRLKVSSCAVLTQSRNNGNNLQFSEKFFRRSEISTSRIQATLATAQGVAQ